MCIKFYVIIDRWIDNPDRKIFDEFDPSSIAKFDEERLLSIRLRGNTLLSEPKLRAIIDNAKHLLKVRFFFKASTAGNLTVC